MWVCGRLNESLYHVVANGVCFSQSIPMDLSSQLGPQILCLSVEVIISREASLQSILHISTQSLKCLFINRKVNGTVTEV